MKEKDKYNFFEELKKYLESTPREQVEAGWARTEKHDQVGPAFETFKDHTRQFYKVVIADPHETELHFKNDKSSPEFSSGFFLIKN